MTSAYCSTRGIMRISACFLGLAAMHGSVRGGDVVTVDTPKRSWGTEQVLGEPDTMMAGDIETAWAPLTPDEKQEWLIVGYEAAVMPKTLAIHETYNPGSVEKVTVFDPDGNEVAQGNTGELLVRGAQVIKGYINQPEATRASIQNGWLYTGDIAPEDEHGFLYIVDRLKDMVLRGGENVYCAEVEAAIYEHPAVAEAAVFGVPDDRLGEIVGAAIVCGPDSSLSEDELSGFLSDKLAKFKIPERVWFLGDALPRNANGKFVKRELKETLLGAPT